MRYRLKTLKQKFYFHYENSAYSYPTLKNYFLALLLLFSCICSAQWQQGDGPGGARITSIFANGSELFVGTFEGALYKSDSDGRNRNMIYFNQGNSNADRVIKVGSRIYIHFFMPRPPVFSDDNGVTWINDTTNECPRHHRDGLFFRDTTFTLDSGITWINNSALGGSIENGFRNNHETFILGNNKLFRTLNSGLTWDTLQFSFPQGDFIKSGSNYISTSGEITLDSGLTWNSIPIFSNIIIKQIEHDNFSVYVLTESSGLFFSQDNGITWNQVTTVIPQNNFLNLIATDNENVYVAGYMDGVFVSSDHGTTWNKANQNLNGLTTNIIIAKNSTLFAGTSNGLFKSIDQGLSWDKIDANPHINSSFITDIFINGGNMFIVCGREAYKSIDNGITWSRLNIAPLMYNHCCMAANDSLIFLSGENGLYVSDDRGNTWSLRSSTTSLAALSTIAVLNQNVILSQWGELVVSNDNGITWQTPPLISGPILRVIRHNNKIYACSQTDGIYCSSDSGLSWTNIFNRSYLANLYVNDSIIWAPHILRSIYYSFDDGITFDSIDAPDNFYGSIGFALDSGNIFTSVEAGGVWRTPYMNMVNSIPEVSTQAAIIFPNPAINHISVLGKSGPFVYIISDIFGRRIKKGISFGTIDISYLKTGEYFLSTYDSPAQAVKFVKIN